jgi:hypothetical protein
MLGCTEGFNHQTWIMLLLTRTRWYRPDSPEVTGFSHETFFLLISVHCTFYFFCIWWYYLLNWLHLLEKQQFQARRLPTDFLFLWRCDPKDHGLIILQVSRSYTTTHHSRQDSSGRAISSSQRPLTDSTQQTKHPCPRWDPNPLSQQAGGRRPMP